MLGVLEGDKPSVMTFKTEDGSLESLILLSADDIDLSTLSLDSVYLDDADNIFPYLSFFYLALQADIGEGNASYAVKLIQDPDSPYIEWARKVGHPDASLEEEHPNLIWDKFITADP